MSHKIMEDCKYYGKFYDGECTFSSSVKNVTDKTDCQRCHVK